MQQTMNGQRKRQTQRQIAIVLAALFLCFSGMKNSQAQPNTPVPLVEITEVKNLGLSASNDAKSILQVLWSVNAQSGLLIKSFDLSLEITYADGAVERLKGQAIGTDRKARFEVPTLHLSAGRHGAELRNYKANIAANFTETATRQGNF
jgi:hypothetical protein